MAIILLVVGALVLHTLTIAAGYVTNYLPVRLFDSAEWKAHPEPWSDGYRLSMVNALLLTHDLKSMTREEIVDLLGEPRRTMYFYDWDLVYILGPQRGLFQIDSEWLVIRVAPGEKATEYAIVND